MRRALDRVEALRRLPPIAALIRVMDRYGAAGGPILAAGLAYSALFAIVPALLLLLGIGGSLLPGEVERTAIAETIGSAMPPLRSLLLPALDALARDAASISIVGFVALAWGAGGFARALESGLSIVMGDGPRRGFAAQALMSFASVIVLVIAVVSGVFLAGVAAFVQAQVLDGAPDVVAGAAGVVAGLAGPAVGAFALALVYRYVPPGAPRWSSIMPAAIVVGLVLAVTTRLFVELAPRVIGSAAALGAAAAAFGGLAWFGVTFQAVLIGACWIAEREARSGAAEHHRTAPGGGGVGDQPS